MVGTTAYTQAGTYLAKTTGSEGCDSLFDLVLTLDSAAGTVTSTTACANAPTGTATAIGTAGNAPFVYSWGTNPVQNTATAVGLAGGTYPVTITASNGCSTTINAQVPAHPAINASVQPAWNVLTALPAGADGYHWWNCGNSAAIPGQISPTFTPTTNGSYAVIVALNGCTDTSACVPVGNVGLEEGAPAALVFYPQPASDILVGTVGAEHVQSGNLARFYTLDGTLVHASPLQAGENRWDVRSLPNGVYLLQAGNTTPQRLVIQRD